MSRHHFNRERVLGPSRARPSRRGPHTVTSAVVVAALFVLGGELVREQALADSHPHIDRPTCVAIASAAGDQAVSGGDAKKCTLWDLTKDPPKSLGDYKKLHGKKVSYVAVSRGGVGMFPDKLYRASYEGSVFVSKLDPKDPDPEIKEFKGHTKPAGLADMEVWVVAPSPDGKYAASATNFGEIKLWETEGVNPALARGTVPGSTTAFNPVGGLVFLPTPTTGNQRFIAGHYDGTARVYEMVPIGTTGNFTLANTITFDTGIDAAVNCVAITSDGSKLVTSGFDNQIRVWDLAAATAAAAAATTPPPFMVTMPSAPIPDHADIVWRVAVSPNNNKIASASEDGTIRAFDINTGLPLTKMGAPAVLTDPDPDTHGFMGVAFRNDDEIVYTAGNHKKEHVRRWSIAGFN